MGEQPPPPRQTEYGDLKKTLLFPIRRKRRLKRKKTRMKESGNVLCRRNNGEKCLKKVLKTET
jgi:hypothetical protein